MEKLELKKYFNTALYYELDEIEMFIYNYGKFNCKILVFKDANTVIKIMDEFDPDALEKEDKEFILKNSNKEVLVYVNSSCVENADCFVYGNNNIAFRLTCFL